MNWLLRKFKEPSTWKGFFVLAGIIGYSIDPALQEQIILAVTAVIAIIEIWRNEHKPEIPPIELQSHYTGQHSIVSTTTDDPVVSNSNRRSADAGRMQYVQPDYSPKEPAHPVDQQSGWNG